jgi:dienelactone hydrolase
MSFRTSYVAFPVRDGAQQRVVAAKLSVPELGAGAPAPAVVICHGSDGVDGRGQYYAAALNRVGIATLELDMWASRSTRRGALGRPATIPETLPDAFAALSFAADQPEIDPQRIGLMGFSWGGVVTMLASTRRYADALQPSDLRYRGFAAFYPAVWTYNNVPGHEFGALTGPVLLQLGGADAYDTPETVERFLQSLSPETAQLVRTIVHAGATHAFDRDLPAKTIHDPFAHNGAGGPVLFQFDRAATEAARDELVAFFTTTLRQAETR